jgi:hypothetical protein
LRTYGADVVLTDPLQGSDGAIREARRLAAEGLFAPLACPRTSRS